MTRAVLSTPYAVAVSVSVSPQSSVGPGHPLPLSNLPWTAWISLTGVLQVEVDIAVQQGFTVSAHKKSHHEEYFFSALNSLLLRVSAFTCRESRPRFKDAHVFVLFKVS